MNFTKAQTRILNQIKELGSSFASPAMIARDLNLKIKTIKQHLNKLEQLGAVTKLPCITHEGVNVYSVAEIADFWITPVKA
jgi:DNA-binding MarR family transcriptional regulator